MATEKRTSLQEQEAIIGRDKKDPQDVAEAWIAANKAKVDAWLAGI